MGIFGAMTTAVGGLRAQSYALENISGNIANSQTPGFKRVDTGFQDLIPDMPQRQALAGSVAAYARYTNTLQGDLKQTSVPTNMALNGDGYFMVAEQPSIGSSVTVASDKNFFTRRGDFSPDRQGRLVNGAGYYLKGWPITPNGIINTLSPASVLTMPGQIDAKVTSQIYYSADLPKQPASTATIAAGTATVNKTPSDTFGTQSVPGGSVTVYDAAGNPSNLEIRWAKLAGSPDTWNAFLHTNPSAAVGSVEWENLGADFEFDATGTLTAPTPATATFTGLSVDGVPIGDVNFDFTRNGGMYQRPLAAGVPSITYVDQDGYAQGTLTSVSVSGDGLISGSYSNGVVQPTALVGVARFPGDDFLKRGDGGVFEETLESGRYQVAYAGAPPIGQNYPELKGANVVGGHVEGSNTDIADEFSKMIISQQAYSAGTRVITAAQQLLSDTINMVR